MAIDPSMRQKLSCVSMGDCEGRLSYFGDYHISCCSRRKSMPNNQKSIPKSRTMPYPLHNECCENSLPSCRCSANVLADCLKSSPLYRQQESERWEQAINYYQEMMNNRDQCCTSPPNSPVNLGTTHKYSICGTSFSACDSPSGDVDNTYILGSLNGSLMGSFPSLTRVSTKNRSLQGTNPQSRGDSSLELEAVAAVHELSFAVKTISVSEILPRTPDLIFVNVTTVEGQPYCLELTLKGWRVTSLRHDCMQGDYTRLDLFTVYYDTLYDLMDRLSPNYRNLFSEKLAQKLRMLQAGEDDDIISPPSLSSVTLPTNLTDNLDTNTPICYTTTAKGLRSSGDVISDDEKDDL
ncbi:GSK3B-interacting protein [Dirofilaria immitis]